MAATSAHKNLLMFRDAWQETASLLTDAVDNATSMHHFLAVSGKPHNVDYYTVNCSCEDQPYS